MSEIKNTVKQLKNEDKYEFLITGYMVIAIVYMMYNIWYCLNSAYGRYKMTEEERELFAVNYCGSILHLFIASGLYMPYFERNEREKKQEQIEIFEQKCKDNHVKELDKLKSMLEELEFKKNN